MKLINRYLSSLDSALVQFGAISIDQFILLTLLCTSIAVIIILLRYKFFDKKMELINFFALLCLLVYINIIIQLTLLGRKSGSRIGLNLSLYRNWNSSHKNNFDLLRTYSILNICFFVPYGLIISLFSFIRRQKSIVQILIGILISFSTSLIIEMLQYVTKRGYFELDDLLCNTLGGFFGCLFTVLVGYLIKKKKTI